MKKTILMAMVCCTVSLSMAFPAFANTWLIDPTPYAGPHDSGTGVKEWRDAEAVAELKQWTDARKDAIVVLPDDMAKYDAVVKAVCDFLQGDINYTRVNLNYTLRDGKGVCADYATLTKALCDAVGIKCDLAYGVYLNDSHLWNKVTLSGKEYYSDVICVDAGMLAYKLSPTGWSDHLLEGTTDDIKMGFDQKWDTGKDVDAILEAPAGMVPVTGTDGSIYYIPQKDLDAAEHGSMSYEQLWEKYGVK